MRKSSLARLRASVSKCVLSSSASKAFRRFTAVLVSSCLVVTPVTVLAIELPTGGKVIVGSATIQQTGANQLLINQASQNAIIEFDTFSIGQGGHVHFANGDGSTLNRVTGGYQSRIDGRLSATGSLLLINTNGVIVGRNGSIDTGGSFLASTRDITNADFLDGGDNTFVGDSDAAVINLGKISSLGGDITLIAHQVVNDGTLEAKNGNVGLASGIEILLRDNDHADGRILVKAGKSGGSVTHSGAIRAASAELRAHSGHVYALAQNRKGTIQVTGAKKSGGRVFLTANGGKVVTNQRITAKRRVVKKSSQATSYQGGEVFINADIVDVAGLIDVSGDIGGKIDIGAKEAITLDNATLDASGIYDGGRIRVGGEFQGGKELGIDEVQNTEKLLITKTSLLDASSLQGDGGTVIAWSDGNTYFGGRIDVSAGPDGGNGGFVETSGLEGLAVSADAHVNALSVNGIVGDWLLDPRTVTIQSGGTATLTEIANAADTTSDLIIDPTAINGAAANVSIVATETINFQDDVNMTNSGVGINAQSGGDINVNSSITSTGLIQLIADADTSGAGTVSFGAGGVISARDVELSSGEAIDLGSITTTQNLTVNTSGDAIVQNAALNIGGTSVFDTTTGGSTGASVSLGNAANDFGGAVDVAGADVVLRDQNSIELGDIDASGSLVVSAVDTISDGATVGSNSDVNVGGYASLSANNIVLDDLTNDFVARVDLFGGNLTISDANDIVFERITASGNLVVNAGGSIADSTVCGECSDIYVAGTSDLNAGTTITLDNSLNDFGGAVDAAGTDIQISDVNDLTFGDVDASGNLVAVAGGAITDNGDGAASGDDINVAGTTSLTANDEITLDDAFNDFGGRVVASSEGVRLKDVNTIVLGDINANSGSVFIDAPTIDLDGDLTGSSISGTASLVNVLGTTNGANIPDAIDVGTENARITLAAGTYGSFTADKAGQTFSGTGTGTIIRTGSPAITITANGVTVENMLLQAVGVPAANDHGILLDGTTSPNLTGVVINNITFNNLQDGVRAVGDIGNGDTTSVDVTIKASAMSNIVGHGVHFIDTLDAANILIGGATSADANVIEADEDGIKFDSTVIDSTIAISQNDIVGDDEGIEFNEAVRRSTVRIDSNDQIVGTNGQGILFNDLIRNSDVTIGGATGALGNTLISGGDDAIELQQVRNSRLNIANNETIIGDDEAIDINGRVRNGSIVNIVGNTEIIGDDSAIKFSAQTRTGSEINIAGNELIDGQGDAGIIFEAAVLDSTVNIGATTANLDIDGTSVGFGQNDEIFGDVDGIATTTIGDSSFNIAGNGSIVGGEDGIFIGNVRNSDVEISANDFIFGGFIGSGIQFAGDITENSNIDIVNNGFAAGLGAGIFFGDITDIGGTRIDASNVEISGNTGIGGILGGIMFASELVNDTNVLISDNDFTLGALFGIDFISDIVDSRVEISDNGVIGALGTGIQIGSILNPGSTLLENSTFIIADNDAVIGLAGNSIHSTSIMDGSTLRIIDNGTIQGGQDGVRTDELIVDSTLAISGNDNITGLAGDGVHIDGPTYLSTVRINSNNSIIGDDDGIDIAIVDDSSVAIRDNQLIEGNEHGIEFDDSFRAGSIIGQSNVQIVGNDHINGKFSDAIVVKSDIRGQSQFSVLRNNEITGGGNGILFAGNIRNGSEIRIAENGTAELNGQSYDPNDKVNNTFATSRFVSGVEGSSVAFYGDVQDRARVNINRNMLGNSYDGVGFYGDVTSSRTQRINNNFILQNSNNGIAFGSDFSQVNTTVSSSFEIFQNYIIQNRNNGISVGALTDVGTGIDIHQNFIPGSGFTWGNQNLAINKQGSGTLNIDGNWWGSANVADIALTLAGVAAPTNFLTSGQDTNVELSLGASNFDPFAFQAGTETPTTPVDPDDPRFANITCEISLDESDLIDIDNLADRENLENRIEARCIEDPEEIGEVSILLRN